MSIWNNGAKHAGSFSYGTKHSSSFINLGKSGSASGFALLEDGFYLLLEDGGRLVLEDSTTTYVPTYTNQTKH